MLAALIIVFREILEIVLVISALVAATNTIQKRGRYLIAGIIIGSSGGVVLAFFTNSISNLASGVGQELFNAAICIMAASLIGWTVLWMRVHASTMNQNIKQIGNDIKQGKSTLRLIAVIAMLATLRESSEIVLFLYSLAISGQGYNATLIGGLLGLISGLAFCFLLYHGLVKINTRYFFSATSWLLILLVSGMMLHAARFLSGAGYFAQFSTKMWDSSWLISDQGIMGKILSSLIGYTAMPSQIELLFYCGTLFLLCFAVKVIDRKHKQI